MKRRTSEMEIPPGALLDATERQRLKQMEINCRWLMDITDRIHDALCPGQYGTWQERAKQAVEAAERLASNAQGHTLARSAAEGQ